MLPIWVEIGRKVIRPMYIYGEFQISLNDKQDTMGKAI